MSLRQYITEAEVRQNIPEAGDHFDIELEDGTLLETYIIGVKNSTILLDATPKIISVLREWADLDGEAGEVLFEGQFKQSMHVAAESMILEDFVQRYGHLFSPKEAEQFWQDINDPINENVWAGVNPRVDQPLIKGTDQRAKSGYYPEPKAPVKKLDVPTNKFDKITKENDYDTEVDRGEYDYEGDMAKDDLQTIVRAARRLTGMLDDNENMPEWVQSKINKAADYVDTAADYIESNQDEQGAEEEMDEAKYQGREVALGKPTRGDVKKFKVYVRDPSTGNIKKVNFGHGGTSAKRAGQKTMKIKKSDPARRRSFRARHNCDNPGPRTKARYWSCRAW